MTILFIRNEDQPVGRLGCGSTFPAFEFKDNALLVDEADTTLMWHLRAEQYEEIDSTDPRYNFILAEGWSRHAQLEYERQNPVVEEPPPEG